MEVVRQTSTEVLAVKEAVRSRDGYRCVRCHMTADEHRDRYGKTLDVHRKEPGAAYTVDGCETLCRACHGPEPKRAPGEPDRSGHRSPRRMIQLPAEWVDILDGLAAKNRQPLSWWLVEAIREQAQAQGFTDLPPVPWGTPFPPPPAPEPPKKSRRGKSRRGK